MNCDACGRDTKHQGHADDCAKIRIVAALERAAAALEGIARVVLRRNAVQRSPDATLNFVFVDGEGNTVGTAAGSLESAWKIGRSHATQRGECIEFWVEGEPWDSWLALPYGTAVQS